MLGHRIHGAGVMSYGGERLDAQLTHRLDQLDAEWQRRLAALEREVSAARSELRAVEQEVRSASSNFGDLMVILSGPFLLAVIIWMIVLRTL